MDKDSGRVEDAIVQGKGIVVTGAGAGLGRAYALALAAAGAGVIVNDVADEAARETCRLVAERGGTAIPVVGSVADWATAERIVDRCASEFGAVDGLVNNAAVIHRTKPWSETEEQLRRIVEVNILGALFLGRHALARMITQGTGSIVNVASGSALGITDLSAYGVTKGAALSATYGWALEAAECGSAVRVNAIMPRAATAMDPPAGSGPIVVGQAGRQTPPPPSADVIAPLVVHLMSDRSVAVSGAVIRYDGQSLAIVEQPSWNVSAPAVGPLPADTLGAVVHDLLREGA